MIFEIINGEIDLTETIHEIAELFEDKILVRPQCQPLEKAISRNFIYWESRGKYTDLYKVKRKLGIDDIRNRSPIDELKAGRYLEYIINMMSFVENGHWRYYFVYGTRVYVSVLKEKVENLLSQLNWRKERVPDTSYSFEVLIDDAGVRETTKIVDGDVARDILRYNHVTACNDLNEKRKILSSLYRDFELRKVGVSEKPEGDVVKKIFSDTRDLFNNLDIRHNPSGNKNTQFEVEGMRDSEKIELYDRCFQLYVTTILINKYVNEHKDSIEKYRKKSDKS